ncbi:MAG: hypothetical protein ACO38P_08210 [Phycisphaerales bacterium]
MLWPGLNGTSLPLMVRVGMASAGVREAGAVRPGSRSGQCSGTRPSGGLWSRPERLAGEQPAGRIRHPKGGGVRCHQLRANRGGCPAKEPLETESMPKSILKSADARDGSVSAPSRRPALAPERPIPFACEQHRGPSCPLSP